MHHIVKSTPGPLGTTDLPILDLSSGGFMKCFIDVIVDESGKFTVVKIVNLKDKKITPDFVRDLCEGKPEQERSLEEWDFGLDFIEEKQLLPWVNGRDSAIYRWPQALMEKSLRDLGQDGVLARVHEVWPLTLYDFILDGKGTWIAWYTRNDGVLRSGFAGKRGLTAQTISPTKPPLNQPLLDIEKGIPTYVSHSDFMKMLESAWCSKDCSDANILAVLKRTHIFVNTAKCLRIRPASETEGPVLRDKIDFLPVDSRKVYDYHRKGGKGVPQDVETKVNWERDWVAKAMGGEMNLPGLWLVVKLVVRVVITRSFATMGKPNGNFVPKKGKMRKADDNNYQGVLSKLYADEKRKNVLKHRQKPCKLRKDFVGKEERNIVFGNQKTWVDVEADEATFDKRDISQDPALQHLVVKKNETIMWEQWGGVTQRGRPRTLVLRKLIPKLTVKRAPGPGAIRKTEWNTIANEFLLDRKDRIAMNQHCKAGSSLLRGKLCSAQYEYWFKNQNLWFACGDLCTENLHKFYLYTRTRVATSLENVRV
ncbi:hypothetical protein AK812_SmicGene28394 [Symbiodinium microadriaticum]|uniref:Uncharacterized protein n=1 Tax=Symbiodinium microadriaticum TaxID=2951 RepID=A0A1Q9D4J3_SYMMI|nr:hypothetical protein AK812_SmicGene28394 [Symbiodinium microadriaticum]